MKRPGPTTTATVWKVRGARSSQEPDQLAAEEPMEIRVESGPKGQRSANYPALPAFLRSNKNG